MNEYEDDAINLDDDKLNAKWFDQKDKIKCNECGKTFEEMFEE